MFIIAIAAMAASAEAQVSPELLPDGRVTFRCRAPKATEVKAEGQFGKAVLLEKGQRGIWHGTTAEAVAPGIFEYHLKIDGQKVIDARNSRIKPQRWPGSSILHVPANPPSPWDLQDIPHGTVHHHVHRSCSLGAWRDLVVYTPPREAGPGPFPVLYLAHGYSDSQRTWTVHGKAHWIIDALIHEGKAEPMIVVMPNAHATDPEAKPFHEYFSENTPAFCKDLIEDVIPFVEKRYPVRTEAGARAFAGLSMGGGHAMTVALQHSDRFAYIGAFSSAPPGESLIQAAGKNADAINRNLKVFWIACGDKDFLFERNQKMHASLEAQGIKHDYRVTKGDAHSWPVWRRYLVEFVVKPFRP